MTLLDQLKWVRTALFYRPKRSLLSLLGVAIGVTTVILMSALGDGVKHYVVGEFTQFGTNLIAVTPGKTQTMGMTGILNTVRPLSLNDVAALQKLPEITRVVPMVMGNGVIKTSYTANKHVKYKQRATDIFGTTAGAFSLWKMPLAQGSYLPTTYDDNSQVAVIGHKLKQELFGNSSALGKRIKVKEQRFKVVGVLHAKGQFLGFNMDDAVYIPAVHALKLFNRESLMEIDLSYSAAYSVNQVVNRVSSLLIKRHKMKDFTIVTQDAMLETLDNILDMVRIATLSLGLIALFVGAVGITSLALIQLKERQHENWLVTRTRLIVTYHFETVFVGVCISFRPWRYMRVDAEHTGTHRARRILARLAPRFSA